MKSHLRSLAPLIMLSVLSASFLFSPGQTMADDLKVGDVAPNFKMTGSDGKSYELGDFKGKKYVVVAWFPKAFTGG